MLDVNPNKMKMRPTYQQMLDVIQNKKTMLQIF
jgi:hypothetical protein